MFLSLHTQKSLVRAAGLREGEGPWQFYLTIRKGDRMLRLILSSSNPFINRKDSTSVQVSPNRVQVESFS